jgi:hypothetical protein
MYPPIGTSAATSEEGATVIDRRYRLQRYGGYPDFGNCQGIGDKGG